MSCPGGCGPHCTCGRCLVEFPRDKGCARPDCHCAPVSVDPRSASCPGRPTFGGYGLPEVHAPGVLTRPTRGRG